jgi:hypothetical protein
MLRRASLVAAVLLAVTPARRTFDEMSGRRWEKVCFVREVWGINGDRVALTTSANVCHTHSSETDYVSGRSVPGTQSTTGSRWDAPQLRKRWTREAANKAVSGRGRVRPLDGS